MLEICGLEICGPPPSDTDTEDESAAGTEESSSPKEF